MQIKFAFRDEIVNIAAMTTGNDSFVNGYQIMLCKKYPLPIKRMGLLLLEPKKTGTSFQLSETGMQFAKQLGKISGYQRFAAIIDSQIKIKAKYMLFDELCKAGFFSTWAPSAPMQYYGKQEEGYILLFRVYKLDASIKDEAKAENSKSKGRKCYYGLDKAFKSGKLFPVISDTAFDEMKSELIDIFKRNHSFISIDQNDLQVISDAFEDQDLIEKIRRVQIGNTAGEIYVPKPESKKAAIVGKTKKYPRDVNRSINALRRANYKCEVDHTHQTFLRKSDGKPYTEPHHLIPVNRFELFDVDIDVEANIISLCSNCHNLLHYGKGCESVIEKLLNMRRDEMIKAGISVNLKQLIDFYK